jgi:tape measure domain-containing protein
MAELFISARITGAQNVLNSLKQINDAAAKSTGATQQSTTATKQHTAAAQANAKATSAMSGAAGGAVASFGKLKGTVAGLAAALGAREIVQAIDTFRNLEGRLKLVTESTEELAAVQRRLAEIANESGTSLESVINLFARVARNSEELNLSNQELLKFVENINRAVAVSGASATEAANALIQLSQGLASGELRGEELRSVMEQLPSIIRILTRELGVTIGELRKMAEEGELTADVITRAVLNASDTIEREFGEGVPSTVGRSFQRLTDAASLLVFEFDKSVGVTERLANQIDNISSLLLNLAFGDFSRAFESIGSLIAGQFQDVITAARFTAEQIDDVFGSTPIPTAGPGGIGGPSVGGSAIAERTIIGGGRTSRSVAPTFGSVGPGGIGGPSVGGRSLAEISTGGTASSRQEILGRINALLGGSSGAAVASSGGDFGIAATTEQGETVIVLLTQIRDILFSGGGVGGGAPLNFGGLPAPPSSGGGGRGLLPSQNVTTRGSGSIVGGPGPGGIGFSGPGSRVSLSNVSNEERDQIVREVNASIRSNNARIETGGEAQFAPSRNRGAEGALSAGENLIKQLSPDGSIPFPNPTTQAQRSANDIVRTKGKSRGAKQLINRIESGKASTADLSPEILGALNEFGIRPVSVGSFFGGGFSTRISGLATGGSKVVTTPSLIAVAEQGPELVSAEPLAGRNAEKPSDGGIHLHMGTVIADDLGMVHFARRMSRNMRQISRRAL